MTTWKDRPVKGTILAVTTCQDCEKAVNVLQSGGTFAYYTCPNMNAGGTACGGHHKFSPARSNAFLAQFNASEGTTDAAKITLAAPLAVKGKSHDWFDDI